MNERNTNKNLINPNEKLTHLDRKTYSAQADGALSIQVERAAGLKRCNRGKQ